MDVLLDTDIGTDIDDAFALALALRSPEIVIRGISTVSGDTVARARVASKMLALEGKTGIPVVPGKASRTRLTHGGWASDISIEHDSSDLDAVCELYWSFIDKAGSSRVQVIALGPMTNLAAIRDRDPASFDEHVSILAMGGSIKKGYFGLGVAMPEYNIVQDKGAARRIFGSAVPLTLVPLDVTATLQLSSDSLDLLHARAGNDPLVQGLADMMAMFHHSLIGRRAAVMFDPATIALLVDASIGSLQPLHLHVSQFGFTRVKKRAGGSGAPEHQVCTSLDEARFFTLLLSRLARPR